MEQGTPQGEAVGVWERYQQYDKPIRRHDGGNGGEHLQPMIRRIRFGTATQLRSEL